MKNLRDIIFSEEADMVKGKYKINFEKAQAFKEACEILEGLKAKGILDYEAEDPRKPYSYHAIQVKFNFKDSESQLLKGKDMAELMSRIDELLVSDESIVGEWQLGSKLYSMTD